MGAILGIASLSVAGYTNSRLVMGLAIASIMVKKENGWLFCFVLETNQLKKRILKQLKYIGKITCKGAKNEKT